MPTQKKQSMRQPTRQSKRLSNKKSSSNKISYNKSKLSKKQSKRLSNKKTNNNRNSSNNTECTGWIPKGTIFKPSETTPDGYGYSIIKYKKKENVYLCGNIVSHHKDMNGTPFPCKFLEEVIDAEWQPKKTRDDILKLKKKLKISK